MLESHLIKSQVLHRLQHSVKDLLHQYPQLPTDGLKVRIEYSRDEKFGDYSTPFAMENKNIFGKSPMEIASELLVHLEKHSDCFSVNLTAPGFLNFRMNTSLLLEFAHQNIDSSSIFAKAQVPESINLEFVSANPTGPLNIVSARAAAVGDSLARLLATLGHKVSTEFYVNDYGNQVFLLGVALFCRMREQLGETLSFQDEGDTTNLFQLLEKNILPFESYRGEYIIDIAKELLQSTDWKQRIQNSVQNKIYDSICHELADIAVEKNLESQEKDLKDFGVEFDLFFREKSLHDSNEVLKTLKWLEDYTETIYEQDGKKFFRSTSFGDDKDRVVLREDGRPTYYLADIAYHKTKIDRKFHRLIDIWGPDHHGYIPRMQGAMMALGLAKNHFKVIIAQQVNLLEYGKKVKMSKRLGVYQTMKDLMSYLGESGKDVARYFFLMRSMDAPLDFDLDLAKDESDKNPVFYIQYANARISSIFREIGRKGSLESFRHLEMTEERTKLLFWICRFPEEVYDASVNFEPHRLVNYLQNLSRSLTRLYSSPDNRLKDSPPEKQEALGYLLELTQICLRKGLGLLGISSPDRLEKTK